MSVFIYVIYAPHKTLLSIYSTQLDVHALVGALDGMTRKSITVAVHLYATTRDGGGSNNCVCSIAKIFSRVLLHTGATLRPDTRNMAHK